MIVTRLNDSLSMSHTVFDCFNESGSFWVQQRRKNVHVQSRLFSKKSRKITKIVPYRLPPWNLKF